MAAKDELGRRGERLAERHLLARGYRLVERNWRCRHGEIDLVVRDGDATALVELLTVPGGLGVDGDDRLVAEILAVVARTQSVPADGSLLALGWTSRPVAWTWAPRVKSTP